MIHHREQHLHPDKAEDDRKPDVEVAEELYHAGEEEVEGPQAQNSEDVGCDDDERISGYAEDGRDGVHGEYDVRSLHHQKHQKQWRDPQCATAANKEPLSLIVLGNPQPFPSKGEYRVSLWVNLVNSVQEHLDTRHEDKDAEDVQNPIKLFDQLCADENEGEAQHHGPHDAPEQNAVLVPRWDGKVGEDDRPDENVVHGER